nr:hypothetical protein [Tanacetum cinerariifolium]
MNVETIALGSRKCEFDHELEKVENDNSMMPNYVEAESPYIGRVVDLHMSELKEFKQVASVKEYHDSFIDVLNRLQHPQRSSLSCFTNGLKEDIRCMVMLFKPQTIHEAYCLAKLLEVTLEAIKPKELIRTTPLPTPNKPQKEYPQEHRSGAARNVELQLQEPWQFDRDSLVKVYGDEGNFDITQSDINFFANLFVMEDGIEFLIREHANIKVPLAKSNKHRQSSSDVVAALVAENFEWKPGLEFLLVEKGRKIHGLVTYSLEVGLIKNKLETVNKWLVK